MTSHTVNTYEVFSRKMCMSRSRKLSCYWLFRWSFPLSVERLETHLNTTFMTRHRPGHFSTSPSDIFVFSAAISLLYVVDAILQITLQLIGFKRVTLTLH